MFYMVIATQWDKDAKQELFYPYQRLEMLDWIERYGKEGYKIEIHCFNRNMAWLHLCVKILMKNIC